MKSKEKILLAYYKKLRRFFGHRNWWPGETPFEVMVGAILTQNTNWVNVEKAIANLKAFDALSPEALYKIDVNALAQLIRSSGYFNIKAQRLKAFIKWFVEKYDGSINKLKKAPMEELRLDVLSIKGVGKETADSILLYALAMPTFVVDAYTHRVFSRHALVPEEADYDEIKEFFESNLPKNGELFNDYHAQIVEVAKNFCHKAEPFCHKCPLKIYLPK